MGNLTMGVASSLSPGQVLSLSPSRLPAYLPNPPKRKAVGIIFIADPRLGFSSPVARGVAEELSAQGDFLVLYPDLTIYRMADGAVPSSPTDAMILEALTEVEITATELKARGATRIGIVGFGEASNFAITCMTKSKEGILAACACGGDVDIAVLNTLENPALIALARKSQLVPTNRAATIASAVEALSRRGLPIQIKVFEHEDAEFVEVASPAVESTVDELCKFFDVHLDAAIPEDWRVESFLERPLTESDWWDKGGDFKAIGLSNWETARENWRKPLIAKRPPRPPLVSYEAVVGGFSSPRRTFELPGRMTLSNMVSVLVDIWDVEGED